MNDLQPAVADFAEFTDGQIELLPVLDDLNRCMLRRGPARRGEQRIDDGAFSTGLAQLRGVLPGAWSALAGESQNFDGNGHYMRFQAGGGRIAVQTPVASGAHGAASRERESATPLGTRPAKQRRSRPTSPSVKCHTQPVPDLSDAPIGGGP